MYLLDMYEGVYVHLLDMTEDVDWHRLDMSEVVRLASAPYA